MNSPGHIQVDEEVLAKYLSGEASPEEAMAVDNWVKADDRNRRLFEQAMKVWEGANTGPSWQLPDPQIILAAIRAQAPAKSSGRIKAIRWSIAAAVLLLLGATGLYVGWQKKNTGQPLLALITRTAQDTPLQDILPDHSLAIIQPGSTIAYTPGFSGTTREVQLTGNATFDVTSNPAKPFRVRVGDIQVQVLGTVFRVREDSELIRVQVNTGAVKMYRNEDGIILKAGQTGSYDKALHRFITDSIPAVGAPLQSFTFTNASLKDMATQLEKAYGIRVVFKNKKLEACTMSSSFDNKTKEFIFDVISITLNVQCRIEKDTVYISGRGCNE
ncbi:FecR domain-containing protein [Chitinophaga eiseniae]|uniref:DUF4974 domain-containing protein n=1 Tax=Chitinophaga eiseniae TaxID=634771 RepID=A0A847SGG6_9BACT|nr:FecR domain-containing protein [Chitinophaga eiseniae]NLR77897.1 DUF4974 domain-containing protein [Chitinophaga eiseniae]